MQLVKMSNPKIFVVNDFSMNGASFTTGLVSSQQESKRKPARSNPCDMSQRKNIVRARLQKKLKAKKDAEKK